MSVRQHAAFTPSAPEQRAQVHAQKRCAGMDRICSRTVQVLWPSDCLAAVVSARMDVPMREPDAARPARRAANPHAPTHAIKLPPMRSLALGIGICAKGAARRGGGGWRQPQTACSARCTGKERPRGRGPSPSAPTDSQNMGFLPRTRRCFKACSPFDGAARGRNAGRRHRRYSMGRISVLPAGESETGFSSLNQTKSRGPLGFTLALLHGCKQNRLYGIFFSPS